MFPPPRMWMVSFTAILGFNVENPRGDVEG